MRNIRDFEAIGPIRATLEKELQRLAGFGDGPSVVCQNLSYVPNRVGDD